MNTKRTNFTDAQKAEIYARDRATCSFTGANLWLLEAPIRPGYEPDWVDHIKPSTRGGPSELLNGVCASATFNAKKGRNTSDSIYLFRNGAPTDWYYGMFGELPVQDQQRLSRMEVLQPHDWYFNRAIGLAFLGFDWKCYKKRYGTIYKRDDTYWFNAAYKKLDSCFIRRDQKTLQERGLAEHVAEQEWLQLESVRSMESMRKVLKKIFPRYSRNFNAWASYFWDAKSRKERESAIEKAQASNVDQETLGCMKQDYALRND